MVVCHSIKLKLDHRVSPLTRHNHDAKPTDGGQRGARYWMSARLNRLRGLFKASEQYVRDTPPLKWAFRVLYWSPLYVAFVQYGYTIKYVNGKSMQVRSASADPCLR